MNNDTIFALSSGRGKSGVAVIRVSGENLGPLAHDMIGRGAVARHAYFVNLRDSGGDLIDQCLVIYFPAPNSFTGQDVIEIHVHGASAVIQKIFEYLRGFGARMATPGEFSRRAFYNNKMDLADVDGLAALLDAQTDMQRKYALRSLTGGDSAVYSAWRSDMIEIAAYAAAITDYADDDLPENIGDTVRGRTKKLYDEISLVLNQYSAARALRSGFNVVLAGAPNVGKSSLFNKILGTNRAIVSDIAGTTRDVVDAEVDIDGFLVRFLDTAGLREETSDTIEAIGIQKTRTEMADANIVLHVVDNAVAAKKIKPSENAIVVINKADINDGHIPGAISVSAKTGFGMDALMAQIKKRIHAQTDGLETGVVLNARTHELLRDAHSAIDAANRAPDWDIFSENVRVASNAIGQILGVIATNDVLDATFSQLCLGK